MGEFEIRGVRLDGNIKTDSKQIALLCGVDSTMLHERIQWALWMSKPTFRLLVEFNKLIYLDS